jgi:membrane-bound ClpP family serine protease
MVYLELLREFLLARGRKRYPRLPVVSSLAIVNTDLNPNGSVLACGELWNAETLNGNFVPHAATVTIVGFRNHLLLVEERS